MKITAAQLLEALVPGTRFETLNVGTYEGTDIPRRKVSADHVLTINTQGRLDDHDGGWVS